MKTLQEMLHARASGDHRAANAIVDVKAGRVRILFGDVGKHNRVTLGIEGNEVRILHPTDLVQTPADQIDQAAAAAARKMTPDNLQPGTNLAPNAFSGEAAASGLDLVERDGKFYAGEDGPEIRLPVGMALAPAGVDPHAGQPIVRAQTAGGDPNPASGPDSGDSGDGGAKAEAINPEDHTKDELLAIAEKEGAEVKASDNKAEIAKAINDKRAAPAAQ